MSRPFWIVHEDADIVVVEKAFGLLTVPVPSGKGADLVTLLRRHFAEGDRLGTVYAAHRLDRPVSGLVVLARSRPVLEGLIAQFAKHEVERTYIACVQGLLEEDEGRFESELLEEQGTLRMKQAEGGRGRRAITHWAVQTRIEASRVTIVEVRLETGLKNQIRVHFADAGHPLLGERKYLPEGHPDRSSVQGRKRIFLHASTLGFTHPVSGAKLRFEAKLPPDLARWRKDLIRPPAPPKKRKKNRHRDRKNKGKRK